MEKSGDGGQRPLFAPAKSSTDETLHQSLIVKAKMLGLWHISLLARRLLSQLAKCYLYSSMLGRKA